MSNETTLLDNWRIAQDGDPEAPFFVYNQADAENTTPGGSLMLCGRYGTWREAKQGAIHHLLNHLYSSWCTFAEFEAFVGEIRELAKIGDHEARTRIARAKYVMTDGRIHYVCPRCWVTCCDPNDAEFGFCSNCRGFTSDGAEYES